MVVVFISFPFSEVISLDSFRGFSFSEFNSSIAYFAIPSKMESDEIVSRSQQVGDHLFIVPSFSNPPTRIGQRECPIGLNGAPCKHQFFYGHIGSITHLTFSLPFVPKIARNLELLH